jgi:integrase
VPDQGRRAGEVTGASGPYGASGYALADAADERYHALVLLAALTSLRWGELAALRRTDIDIQARTVRVTRQLNERHGGGFAFSPPKSESGQRIVAIPELIVPDLAAHVMTHARPGDDGLVFTSPGGGPLRHTNFRRRFWVPALQAAGLPLIHFHDLRHTGNMLAEGRGVASDATFRDRREDGLAGPAALPGGRRAGGRSAGHAVDQGLLGPGCAG